MVRTKQKQRSETSKKRAKAAAGKGASRKKGAAEDKLTLEEAKAEVQFRERSFRGDPKSLGALGELPEDSGGNEAESHAIGFSQALAWKEEPEWQGESSEDEAETGNGSREPEDQVI